jgi:hypothetical protein
MGTAIRIFVRELDEALRQVMASATVRTVTPEMRTRTQDRTQEVRTLRGRAYPRREGQIARSAMARAAEARRSAADESIGVLKSLEFLPRCALGFWYGRRAVVW